MSPNATLLAYSGRVNIKNLRDEAALLSQLWKESSEKLHQQSAQSSPPERALETLTIESTTSNIIIRAIQPRLLLALVGGVPPSRSSQCFTITPEARGDSRYPPATSSPSPSDEDSHSGSPHSRSPPLELLTQAGNEPVIDGMPDLDEIHETRRIGILSVQRRLIDKAADFMRTDFGDKGFFMPDEASIA